MIIEFSGMDFKWSQLKPLLKSTLTGKFHLKTTFAAVEAFSGPILPDQNQGLASGLMC